MRGVSRKERETPVNFGRGSVFAGELVCHRSIALYGSFTGSISSGGTIFLEKRATIAQGPIKAVRIVVAGSLSSSHVQARMLELQRSAHFDARADVHALRCESGARLLGTLRTGLAELKSP